MVPESTVTFTACHASANATFAHLSDMPKSSDLVVTHVPSRTSKPVRTSTVGENWMATGWAKKSLLKSASGGPPSTGLPRIQRRRHTNNDVSVPCAVNTIGRNVSGSMRFGPAFLLITGLMIRTFAPAGPPEKRPGCLPLKSKVSKKAENSSHPPPAFVPPSRITWHKTTPP